MVGGGVVTSNFVALLAVPPSVVTLTYESTAPLGTMTVTCVSESTVKVAAASEPNRTLVAVVKLDPVTVTLVPTGPDRGSNDVIVGTGCVTLKFVALLPVPPGVVTLIGE